LPNNPEDVVSDTKELIEQPLTREQIEDIRERGRFPFGVVNSGDIDKLCAMALSLASAEEEKKRLEEALRHIKWIKDGGIDGRNAYGEFVNFADAERDTMYQIAVAALSPAEAQQIQTDE
jgi:hypothetical protein